MAGVKEHRVQVIVGDVRYEAIERDGRVRFRRGGDDAGGAKWHEEQYFHENTSLLPDNIFHSLERKLKEAIEADDA